MPEFLHNLGLEVFTEDEDTYRKLVGHVLSQGKAIYGYFGLPYINHHLGWAQMIARIGPVVEGKYQFNALDTHCAGICYWDVRISSVMKDPDNDDPLSKVLVVKGMDGKSLAAVHIVNADVLPSFAEDEVIRLQMIAFPEDISYYPDAQDYEATVKPDKFGKKISLGENCLFPIGIFSETNEVPVKTITQIRGVVKRLLWGEVKLGDDTINPFIDCIVETQMGEIEILHTVEMVEESQRENLKVGATVNCLCYLSGDPAINAYAHGIVLDHEHHLKLLAYSFSEGDPERLRRVLANHFTYDSEVSNKHIDNADEYIELMKHVQEKGESCHPHYATITQAPDDSDYPAGTRCLVLSYGSSEKFTSMAFIDMNADNKIHRIRVSKDLRYQFKIDDPLPEPEGIQEIFKPRTTIEAMLCRAHFHCIVPKETDEEIINTCIRQHWDEFTTQADYLGKSASLEELFTVAFELGIRKRGKIHYDDSLIKELAAQFVKDHCMTMSDDDTPQTALAQSLLYMSALGYLCEDDIPYKGTASTDDE